nr:hypothetical protein [Tanacetum cinerariifolium]
MRARRSVRTSPLAYDPEVERSVRLRRNAVRQFFTNLDFAGLKELFIEMSDDNVTGAESPPRGVDSYYRPGNFEDPLPIVYPAAANGAVSNFKIQPNLIAILPVFRGHEEAYAHLREFFSIADIYQVNNTTKDGVRLRLFPFSLKDQYKAWFTSLEPGEQFYEAFSRLKELLRTFPHHDVPKWELVKILYDGLDYQNQQFVMATSGGTVFLWPMEEEWGFFEKLSKGSKTHASVDQNNNHTSFTNFLSNQHGTNSEISELSKKVDLLLRNLGKGFPNVSQVSHNARSMCGDPSHSVNNCQSWGHHRMRRMMTITIALTIPNNKTMVTNHGMRVAIHLTSNKITNNKAPTNKGHNKTKIKVKLAKKVHKQEAGKLPIYPDLNPKHKPGGFEHVNMDLVTDDESVVEGKKDDNMKSDSKLVNDLLKDFSKPPTQNPKATESPKVGEGCVSSTTTPYPAALEKLASARLAKNVVVGNISIKKALINLGASINILPASLVDKYDLGTLRKTDTIISLTDRSTKIPRGILEVDVINEEVQKHAPCTLKDDPLELYLTDENEEILDIAEVQEIQECLVSSLDHQRPPWSYKVAPLPTNFNPTTKPSLEVPLTLELKPLPSTLKYDFLGHNNTLPVIVAYDISGSQEEVLLKVLSKYKAAVGWTIADLKGINPSLCMHRIVTDLDVKPSKDAQRRLNPNMKKVVKKEVLKWLDTCIIYPISNSKWKFYCFLDWYSGYNQIPIHPDDQAKTTFTCPYGTFSFRRIPFGLCNAPATFHRYMMSIFLDMVRESVEIFMDDLSIFGQSFESCFGQLESVLKRCTETNLVLSWEKSHFMVHEGILLGHVVSEKGFEVDRTRVQIISTLPPPTNIKAVRSFLGHTGFYRRLLKILVLYQSFISPDWSKLFKIMCDASDYPAGAVLGQRVDKKPVVIFSASKTLSEDQMNYTTTEKELVAVVFLLYKFRSYIWGHSKLILFLDQSALKHLLTKKETKPRRDQMPMNPILVVEISDV